MTDNHVNAMNAFVTLSNGVKIPSLGLGTWKLLEEECVSAVKTAILSGYRHIDTATAYRNEKSVGAGIRGSGVPRSELFVTDKLWNSSKGYDEAIRACKKSLDFLGLQYIDLYLIHWPRSQKHFDDYIELNNRTWRAFETLYNDGLVRSIGVSNFLPHHLKPLIDNAKILPMVNQLELSPRCRQDEAVSFSKRFGMAVEAYSPLTRATAFDAPELKCVAQKHNKSVQQVCIRWSLDNGYIPIPKSAKAEHIISNADVFSFRLDNEDMQMLDKLKDMGRVVADPDDPPF